MEFIQLAAVFQSAIVPNRRLTTVFLTDILNFMKLHGSKSVKEIPNAAAMEYAWRRRYDPGWARRCG